MSDHFVEEELGALLLKTIGDVTADGIKTPNLGGTACGFLPFRYTVFR
ncbi:hypothetical protein TGS27_2633 [Geobacillus stearothermophilus]|uniref:Uncharacterized protein n=1 Tax=Geobacillus stearothermophilus TaxID=1422 RepID=A0A150N203_GEOSE|nr:hypothetical protein GS8_95 [Geobacillus stearothermophilus]KYD26473.1 hypothetical protein B4109_2904 [Geobacillus stearothermophilus]KYD30741.1 hypothetical protein B4114_2930 [Geobacillus stearothermophilus]OAO77717.1 hypothetical protein TGS27_2633 [Geobacillus stearothermophilus]